MAKVTLMPGFVQEVHGSLGKNSESERKVVKPMTKMQMDHQERFKLAHEALQVVNTNPLLKQMATLTWKREGKKYATMRGWLMAQLMKA